MNKKKTNGLISAAYVLIALVIVAVVVLAVFAINNYKNNSILEIGKIAYYTNYNDSGYSVGSGEVDAADIKNITIDWVAGDVKIVECEGDKITLTEPEQENEDMRLRYHASGSNLTIKFCKPKANSKELNKELTVAIPKGTSLKAITVDIVSAPVSVTGISCSDFNADTVSGDITLDAAIVKIKADSVSGKLTLVLPEATESVNVDYDTVSGKLYNDFPQSNGSEKEIDFDSVSGDLTIKKK